MKRRSEPAPRADAPREGLDAPGPVATVLATVTKPEPASTGKPAAQKADAPDRIELRFRDASVPPQYHRSYAITLTPASIEKVVTSYGDVLAKQTAVLPQVVDDRLARALVAGDAGSGAVKDEGSTGGGRRSVRVMSGATAVLEASSERCGGSESGPLVRANGWIAEVERLAPAADGPQPAP